MAYVSAFDDVGFDNRSFAVNDHSALAATEGADTAAFSVSELDIAALAVTEAADTAAAVPGLQRAYRRQGSGRERQGGR